MVDQIINVAFTVTGKVQLDLARAEEDPWWEQYSRGLDLNDPEQFKLAVQKYVSAYLTNEQLLSETAPWTCGPASIYSVQIEVKNGGNASTDSTDASV